MDKKKIEQLKEITNSLWSSYQHMYDTRITRMQNKTNFLLITISFLSVISISLFTHFENLFFIFAFLLQLISFVILLKVFFIKNPMIHWFKSEELIENLDRQEFNQNLFADLKALEDDTWVYMKKAEIIIHISVFILLLALYTIPLTLIFIYFNGIALYISVLFLTIISILICIYYMKQPNFKYESSHKKYKKQIDDWIKNGNPN